MKTCTRDDCDRKHVAKGLCSAHYQQANYTSAQRHTKRLMPCSVCGTEVLKYPNGGRYRVVCSYDCRYVLAHGRTKAEAQRVRAASKALVGPLPRERTTTAPTVIIDGLGKPFLSVACAWCGSCFVQDPRVTGVSMLYCSHRCSKARGRRIRKAREHGAPGTYTLAEVVRLWLAFDKRCAYCEQPTDGLPDPDHVTPLSRGGSNSITNILPVCRLCNSDKCDMTLDEWSLDRARRGKPERVTAWSVDDKRVAHLIISAPTRESRVGRMAA